MKRTFVIVTFLAVFVSAVPASAHVKKVPAQISISYDSCPIIGSCYRGQIINTITKCFAQRTVLFMKENGDVDQQVDSRVTDDFGNFTRIRGDLAAGTYYILAPAKRFGPRTGHRHKCLQAQSVNFAN